MYFVIIMAFALVLSDTLPPDRCNLFPDLPVTRGKSLFGTLGIVFGQILLVYVGALWARGRARCKLDGTLSGHDAAADSFAFFQQAALFVLAAMLILTMVFTPWPTLVRIGWGLGKVPLVGDLLLLAPLATSFLIIWIVLYPLEMRLRAEYLPDAPPVESPESANPPATAQPPATPNHALATLDAAKKRKKTSPHALGGYLLDKFRHQVLILAVPMSIIVLAKHLINNYGDRLVPLPNSVILRGLILNTALGTVSVCVLALAPLMLRYIWATEPLPAGPLRDRFTSTCRGIGLRYREILLWHTHCMAVNAAVMGFVAPLRYILVSDALLETMDEDEIEAVFGHEAGHVRHWHLPYFGVFAIISMYAAGGVMHLLFFIGRRVQDKGLNPGILQDQGLLQLTALVVLLAMWLFGFSWLSRKFERQADLFGVRCITPDVQHCPAAHCPVHGEKKSAGLCVTAANLFGRTLGKIADLNGIPRDAPSWRHGSIESRCALIESFTSDAAKLARFDRLILRIKIGLVALTIVGSAVAVWLYYEPVAELLGWS